MPVARTAHAEGYAAGRACVEELHASGSLDAAMTAGGSEAVLALIVGALAGHRIVAALACQPADEAEAYTAGFLHGADAAVSIRRAVLQPATTSQH